MDQGIQLVLMVVGLAVTQLLLGVAAGWWLRDRRVIELIDGEKQTQRFAQHLQRLATSVSDEVDEHSSRMEEINDELSAIDSDQVSVPQEQVQNVLARIVDENKKLQSKLSSAESQLQQARTINVHLAEARIDPLTELPNRRAFNQELARRFAELHRDHHEVSLLVLDIDHFKQFNDTYGHTAGDQVLHQVARALTATMRESDLVSRYGGEEFAIVLPNTDLAQGVRAAERARLAVEREQIMLDGNAVTVTLSVGVAEGLRDDHPRTLFKRADEARYAAKAAGRNRSFVHNGQEVLDVSSLPESTDAATKLAAKNAATGENETSQPDSSDHGGNVDALTGLPNRRQLVDELRKASIEAVTNKACLSLVLLTIDQLPKMRTLHGQAQVDDVLRAAAGIVCRVSEGTVLRFGWEEFAVILPRADIVEANDMDRRLREVLAAELELPNAISPATVSSGITELVTGDDAATFATRAEAALETSRQAGGNCTHFHCYGSRELQEAK